MNSMPCDLSIVIVSWNVWPLLQRCLASIERCSVATAPTLRVLPQGWRLEVIVVDNASADGTPAQVVAHFPWVRVLAQRQNIGFTGGNNRGFATSKGRFLYFLNPDTELVDGTTPGASLATLTARLEADPALGVVGPQLRYSDGSHVRTIGSQGSGNGQFSCPWGVLIDGQGRIIVSDFGNDRIQLLQ